MATTPKKSAVTKTAKALVTIEYDQKRYAPGETFEIREDDVQQLLDVNAIEVVAESASDAKA